MSVSFYNIFQPSSRKWEKEKGDKGGGGGGGGGGGLNAIWKKEGEKQDKGKDRKCNATDRGKENLMLQQTGGKRI